MTSPRDVIDEQLRQQFEAGRNYERMQVLDAIRSTGLYRDDEIDAFPDPAPWIQGLGARVRSRESDIAAALERLQATGIMAGQNPEEPA